MFTKASPDLELDSPLVDDAPPSKRGLFRSLIRLTTLPFRLVAGVVRAIVAVVVLLARIVLLPVRLGVGAVKAIVNLASDITYGIWRTAMKLVGLVVGTVKFVLGVLNATIGGAIRLVFRVVFGSLRLMIRVFTLGKLFGKASAKASEVASKPLDVAA